MNHDPARFYSKPAYTFRTLLITFLRRGHCHRGIRIGSQTRVVEIFISCSSRVYVLSWLAKNLFYKSMGHRNHSKNLTVHQNSIVHSVVDILNCTWIRWIMKYERNSVEGRSPIFNKFSLEAIANNSKFWFVLFIWVMTENKWFPHTFLPS